MTRTANRLIKTLQHKRYTLALAESVTCGLAAHKLTLVKGTSDVLQGGICCYHNNVKCGLLKIRPGLIEKYTPESQRVTDELAKKLSALIKADIHAAITGLSDEGGSETKDKPVGTIFISVYYKLKLYRLRKVFRGTPLTIQTKACEALYRLILKVINEQ